MKLFILLNYGSNVRFTIEIHCRHYLLMLIYKEISVIHLKAAISRLHIRLSVFF